MLKYATVVSLWALVMICCSPALAQTEIVEQMLSRISGTMSAKAVPTMADGKLSGCAIEFEALQQDFKYLGGNYVKVSGTVGLMEAHGDIGVLVKVVAAEFDAGLPNLFSRYVSVSRAYLVDADLQTNFGSLITSAPSTNQGRFSVFSIEPGLPMIIEGVIGNSIGVAYGLEGGSSDVQSTINIDVLDVDADGNRTRSDATKTAFLACTQSLLESMPS